ncbi:MAG: hypothetical protein HYX80_00840 [Chloroflexi bacterium]|nr:hypothetical protein [Chloroflexota bacterium]
MTAEVGISDTANYPVAHEKETPRENEVSSSELLSRIIEEQRHDYYAWHLILFFAEHPYVRFNRLAVIHALNQDNGRRFIQKALDELIEQGIIKASTEGNLPLFSLAEDMRRLVLKLTRPTQNS